MTDGHCNRVFNPEMLSFVIRIYVILLFQWVYFTSFFDHYIEQNML